MLSMRSTTWRSAQNEFGGWSSTSGPEGTVLPQDWKMQAPGRWSARTPTISMQWPQTPCGAQNPCASRSRVNPWFEQTVTG